MRPLVYVAGPITSPDPMENTHEAIKVADRLLTEKFVVPFVPHLTVLWQMISPHGYEDWLAYDFDVIRHCDALLRIEGHSPGADREVVFAHERGIPVFLRIDDLNEWASAWSAQQAVRP